jgi:hypothetical protein
MPPSLPARYVRITPNRAIVTGSGDAFTLEQLYVKRIPKSAKTPEEMLQMCNLTAADIVKAVMRMLQVA